MTTGRANDLGRPGLPGQVVVMTVIGRNLRGRPGLGSEKGQQKENSG